MARAPHGVGASRLPDRDHANALQTYLGHSSITVTLDRSGHLMPGAEGEAAAMLDAYLSPPSAGQGRV